MDTIELFDINGNKIEQGDTIALAMSAGRGAVLNIYQILETPKSRGSYGCPLPVKAVVIQSKHYGRQAGEKSTLHGELFEDRAMIIVKA